MSFSLACVLCPSFVRLLFCSLSLLAQLSWAVFPGSLWRLPVLPLGSVLHAGASVLEARGSFATANLAHGHVCALPFIRSATLLGRSVPRSAGVCSAGLFHAQAVLALSHSWRSGLSGDQPLWRSTALALRHSGARPLWRNTPCFCIYF